jgi:hypothetical protein
MAPIPFGMLTAAAPDSVHAPCLVQFLLLTPFSHTLNYCTVDIYGRGVIKRLDNVLWLQLS